MHSSLRTALLFTPLLGALLVTAGCGSGGGGGGSSSAGGSTGGANASINLSDGAVASESDISGWRVVSVSGTDPDQGVGDLFVLGTSGGVSRVWSPLLPEIIDAPIDAAGKGVWLSDGDRTDIHVIDANTIEFTNKEGSFNSTSGDLESTTTSSVRVTRIGSSAVPAAYAGTYVATVTAIPVPSSATPATVNIGDRDWLTINRRGYFGGTLLLFGVVPISTAVDLVADDGRWRVRNTGSSGKINEAIITADFTRLTAIERDSAGTITQQFECSLAPVTMPTTAIAHVSSATSAAKAGTAPGYTSTAYISSRYPAGAKLNVAIDHKASTITVQGGAAPEVFQLVAHHPVDDAGRVALSGWRGFVDPTLTTADKRVIGIISLELDASGAVVLSGEDAGGIAYSLISDPTPTNDGGSGDNDDELGEVDLVP